MKIVSIQVGLPKEVEYRGRVVTTGIFKEPVAGPVRVNTLNMVGDKQADLTVHGGVDKAVYAFGLDAYPWWREAWPQIQFSYGAFGENLTMDRLPEEELYIGDTFEVGTVVLQIAQPRFPCYKLGVKFNDPGAIKAFMKCGRPGVYFRVMKEGSIEAGDKLRLLSREEPALSVRDLFLFITGSLDFSAEQARSYLELASLPDLYRERLIEIAEDF